MGSAAGNQNSWTPYDYKDCSIGICSIYCPQFCYFIFPPPPPRRDNDDSSPFSPLIIAIIGILACAFVLVSYYTVVTRYCRTTRDAALESDDIQVAHDHRQQAAAAASGLDEAAIKAITVCRYQKGDGLIEEGECAVCLSEFEENECVRLLPKCSHAFHLPCIDTWLKSHSSCPLCRAAVVAGVSPAPVAHQGMSSSNVDAYEFERPSDFILVVDEGELHCLAGGGGDGGEVNNGERRKEREGEEEGVSRHLRRSVSLGRLPSHVVVEMGEIGGDLGMRCQSWRDIGSWKGTSTRLN